VLKPVPHSLLGKDRTTIVNGVPHTRLVAANDAVAKFYKIDTLDGVEV
jgi:hypothetical protein